MKFKRLLFSGQWRDLQPQEYPEAVHRHAQLQHGQWLRGHHPPGEPIYSDRFSSANQIWSSPCSPAHERTNAARLQI